MQIRRASSEPVHAGLGSFRHHIIVVAATPTFRPWVQPFCFPLCLPFAVHPQLFRLCAVYRCSGVARSNGFYYPFASSASGVIHVVYALAVASVAHRQEQQRVIVGFLPPIYGVYGGLYFYEELAISSSYARL